MLFGVLRRSASRLTEAEYYRLADAAGRALAIARKEKLPLAYIAARAGEARSRYWFANNMLHVVSIEAKKPDSRERQVLGPADLEGLTLDADMQALRAADAPVPSFVDPTVSRGEFAKYLHWLRTTQ